MRTRAQRAQLLAETRRTANTYNALVLVIGAVAVTLGVVFGDEGWAETALGLVGAALVSAALVSFVFGAITVRETTLQVDHAVARATEDVLQPVREALYRDALSSYRWDCHLGAPGKGDSYPRYGYQALRISYRSPGLPAELRMLCVATDDDKLLAEAIEDERYIFRWMVDEDLDPLDEQVFRPGEVWIDGERLPRPALESVGASAAAAEYRYALPAHLRPEETHAVDFTVTLRKFLAAEERTRISTQIFRTVTDAEFRLTVDPEIGARAVNVTSSQVTALGPERAAQVGPFFSPPAGIAAATAQFRNPLQAGSAVAFTLDRRAPVETSQPVN